MEIDLHDMFRTDTLRDRQTARLVLKQVSEVPSSHSVVINFEKIVFASRSFVHELTMNLRDKKNVSFENMNEVVRQMMIAVEKKPYVSLYVPRKVTVIA